MRNNSKLGCILSQEPLVPIGNLSWQIVVILVASSFIVKVKCYIHIKFLPTYNTYLSDKIRLFSSANGSHKLCNSKMDANKSTLPAILTHSIHIRQFDIYPNFVSIPITSTELRLSYGKNNANRIKLKCFFFLYMWLCWMCYCVPD